MKKLSTRIILSYFYSTIIIVSLILFFTFQSIKSHYYDSSIKELSTINKSLQFNIIGYLNYKNIDISNLSFNNNVDSVVILNNFVIKLGQKLNTRITIIKLNGEVIADSKENPQNMDNHYDRPEIYSAINGLVGKSTRFSLTLKKEMLYVALPLEINNKPTAVLRTSFLLKDVDKLLVDLTTDIIKILVIVFLFSIIIVYIFSQQIVKPLNQLSFASRKVASGDFELNLKITGYSEIIELTRNFNDMTKRLKKLFSKVNIQREKLNTLISNVQEGIVVLNTKDEITLYNNSFSEIVKTQNLTRVNINKIIKSKKFKILLEEVKLKKTKSVTEIDEFDNYYLISANFIEVKDEVVIVLTDISEIKKLEALKKDLVANASHELRTPLTAIKGFVETLEDEVEGDNKRYVEIIHRHTNRLIALVNDLLTLSELEDKNQNLIINTVNIFNLINNVCIIFEEKLLSKKIEIIKEVDENLFFDVDSFRIEQVLINLIDNAIKYGDNNQVLIKVNLINKNSKLLQNFKLDENYNEYLEIIVADKGNGIPNKDKIRIFERFYTVDKSRARSMGGTGLGLSIVKHIINLHKGEIIVEDNEPKGCIMHIVLPRNTIS